MRPARRGTARRRTARLVGVGVAALLGLAACGEPTAQVIQAADTRFTYELPVDFDVLPTPDDVAPGQRFGPEGAVADQPGSEPIFSLATIGAGDQASYQGLRMLATAGQFDPLQQTDDPLPDGMQVLGYAEINEPKAWGIRLQFLMGANVADFQALVDRETDQIAITEMFCTQACFVEQQSLIDQIQRSWRLEP